MVPRPYISVGVFLAISLTACGGESTPNPIQVAFAQEGPQASPGITVAFRFPSDGNQRVRLYGLPTLDPVNIEFAASEAGTREFVGFVREEDLIYTRNANDELSVLDLTAGRFRTVDTLVQRAVVSPTGVPIVVHTDLSVASIENRVVDRWPTGFPMEPTDAWGTLGSGLLALFDLPDGRAVGIATPEWDEHLVTVPSGLLATSSWGDVLVVATDSGIVSIDPRERTPTRFLRVTEQVTTLSLSPSAHRVYAGLATGHLLVINRFDLTQLDAVQLPGIVEAIRPDGLGRYLLMRPAGDADIWISTIDDLGNVRIVNGEWDEHLPAVAPDGTVLVRNGGELVALDPATGQVTGRVSDAGRDTWALLTWDPRRPTLQVAAQRSVQSVRPSNGVQFFAQVSSTSNLNWAQDEVSRLSQAGMTAALIPQSAFDDRYRVGLGPFPTRDEADDAGRVLGRAFFIVAIDPNDVNNDS